MTSFSKKPLRLLLAGILLLTSASLPADEADPSPARPNLLVVLVDDLGPMDLSEPFILRDGKPARHPLNDRYHTPGVEQLSRSGTKFTQAYACTVCTPSRVSLITGLSPTRHRVTTWTHPLEPLDTGNDPGKFPLLPPAWNKAGVDPDSPTLLPRLLQSHGYRTILIGKAHFGPDSTPAGNPLNLGFDVNIGGRGIGAPGSYLASRNFDGKRAHHQVPHLDSYHGGDTFLTEALTREMKREITRSVKDGKPFFAYMSHYAVHSPFNSEDPRFAGKYAGLPPQERVFATLVEGMDQSLRDLLTTLDELGVAEDTLVVFLGDNGTDAPIPFDSAQIGPAAPLRGKKGHAYEGGVRIPLVISWAKNSPGATLQKNLPITPGSIRNEVATIWDLYPTLLKAAGISVPASIDGIDLSATLNDVADPAFNNREFLLHFPHSHQYEDFYSLLRRGDLKIIYRYLTGTFELYDLKQDPAEQHNLANQPDHQKDLRQMAGLLVRRLEEADYLPPLVRQDQRPAVIQLPTTDK